jgi:hypothetical protein
MKIKAVKRCNIGHRTKGRKNGYSPSPINALSSRNNGEFLM